MSTITVTPNPEYTLMAPHVEQVRDCVKGSPFIKGKRNRYLPHPSSVDTQSTEQQERYNQYLAGAEFDEFTSTSKRVMLGRLKMDDIKFEPSNGLDYLIEDVDKDGLSIKGLAESCAGNVLETKWHLLLADYKGLSDLPLDEVSAQDIKDANPRATIKQYARESVIDWDFKRINGSMQLTYLLLRETGEEVDSDNGSRSRYQSYLKLALDEDGYYYQQKRTDGGIGESNDYGDPSYPMVGSQRLKFIPVSIACDEEFMSGNMPMELGFLAPLGELALARYRVSAIYKEAMSALIPTLHVTGVDSNDWEEFEKINGRTYVSSGAFSPNVWPGEKTQFSLLESSQSLEQFIKYFDDNQEKVKALGGIFNSDASVQRTATEIINDAETTTAVLIPIANSVESAIKWQIAYCAMFEGKVSPENLGEYVKGIEFTMPKDFAISKLSVEEVKAMLDVYMAGLISKEDFLKAFTMGGWSEDSVDELLGRLEEGI